MKLNKYKNIALTAVLIFSANSNAEVLIEHSGAVEAGTAYHSNIQYLDKGAESVYIYSVVPQYQIKALDGLNEWFGTVGIALQRTSNSSIMGRREDPFAEVGWSRELQNGTFGITGEYIKQSTRQTQLADTGLVTQDGTNVTRGLAADWLMNLSEQFTLETRAAYEKTTFSNVGLIGGGAALNAFETRVVQADLIYALNETVEPFIRLSATDFRANTDVKFQDLLVGASVVLTPALTIKSGAGITHFSTLGTDEAVGFLESTYKNARSAFTLEASRAAFVTGANANPTDIGDRFGAVYAYDLSEYSTLGAGLQLSQNKSGLKSQNFSSFYERNFTASWLMRLSMELGNIKGEGVSSINNNTVGISFTYNSLKF